MKAIKHDKSKPQIHYLPTIPLLHTCSVFMYGATKYDDYNYRKGDGLKWSRMYDACLRHLFAWWEGKEKDEETGLSPLYHALCELLMLTDCIERGKNGDDRSDH